MRLNAYVISGGLIALWECLMSCYRLKVGWPSRVVRQ